MVMVVLYYFLGSKRITEMSPGVDNLRGTYASAVFCTQDIEECLLGKVHAADPLQFTFCFLLIF